MRDYTTLSVKRNTKQRLTEAKPYESVSYDEFINEMLDEHCDIGAAPLEESDDA